MLARKNYSLEAAMALLIQNQAALARDMAETRKDFERIMSRLFRLEQLVSALPEAIRDKIGFKTP